MPRGQKQCEKCNSATGPRAYRCPVCGHFFNVQKGITKRRKNRRGSKINWTELQTGDIIRVAAGSGPYWLTNNGEREHLGYGGLFRVQYVDTEGLGCYPVDKKNFGFCFIYMGPVKVSKIGSTLRPHRIRKVEKKHIDRKYQLHVSP